LNIKAYLERINYHGSLAPDAETLRELQVAHLLSVPFENLNIHARQPIVLEDEALFSKIVENRRGGFCYEANGLFAALLRALGFDVAMLAAEVANAEGEYGPNFDHMTLAVTLAQRWLVDVGFGDSFLEPLLLDELGEQVQGSRAYRILSDDTHFILTQRDEKLESHSDEKVDHQSESAHDREGGLAPASQLNAEWKAQYRFTLHSYTYADYAEMCHYHQTSPYSHFTRSRICSRATEAGRITLSEMRFITTSRSGGRQERNLMSEGEYADVLREQFGIVMTS
jgi:N-hydroxyarylamine O-acetyltransferase